VILVLRRSHAVVGCGTYAGLFAADLFGLREVRPASSVLRQAATRVCCSLRSLVLSFAFVQLNEG